MRPAPVTRAARCHVWHHQTGRSAHGCKSEAMDSAELRLLTSLEDRHWWYRERRAILKRELRRLPGPGLALDIGAAGGGNTRVLKAHGWQAIAVEYSDSVVEVARSRGI